MPRHALLQLAAAGALAFGAPQAGGEGAPLRIALVRVDDHAWWFGGFFAAYDEARLERNHPRSARRNRLVRDVELPIPGARVVKVWDADPARSLEFAATFSGVEPCRSLEECAAGIDGALVLDARGDGSDHLDLARPFLERGVATFIDKPFADSARAARQIVDLARRHGAPVYSDSTLPHVLRRRLGERLREAGRLTSLIVSGPLTIGSGAIHQVVALLALLGSGPVSVQNLGDGGRDILHVRYGDDRLGVAHASDELRRGPEPQYHVLLIGEGRTLSSGPIEPIDFQLGADVFLRRFVEMARTREAPLRDEQLLEPIRVLEAGRLSKERGGAVVPLASLP